MKNWFITVACGALLLSGCSSSSKNKADRVAIEVQSTSDKTFEKDVLSAKQPVLVDFYEKHKNENFELVLITSDQEEDSMEKYAKEKKMPWPQLKLKKTQEFKQKFQHGNTGLPSLIVCGVNGEVLGDYRSKLEDLAELIK